MVSLILVEMASEKFRYQLRQEAQQWQQEGIIDPEIYRQLTSRYQLDELDSVSRDRFILVVLGVGFILLGLGVITFVAANWQVWSRPIKVLLLLSLFAATNCGGFYLWRSPNPGKSRLGQGLLLLSALTIGANLGLMSQMFHQTGSVSTLYLVWGISVCAMAYGLRLASLGVMAIILMAIAYSLGLFRDTIWDGADLSQILQQMSLIVAFIFIPLAYYCRSRWLFRLSWLFVACALGTNLIHYLNAADLSGTSILIPLTLILIPALLWSYRDNLLFANFDLSFDTANRKLAVFYLGGFFYICSFNFWTDNFGSGGSGKFINLDLLPALTAPLLFILFSIWAWWRLGIRRDNLPWRLDRNSTYVGAALVWLFGFFWFNLAIASIGIAATIIFNLLLLIMAIVLISQSVKEGQRFNFWLGIILLVLQIFSRMFEYDTNLILKAIALFICGIAAIIAGLWFERCLSRQTSNS